MSFFLEIHISKNISNRITETFIFISEEKENNLMASTSVRNTTAILNVFVYLLCYIIECWHANPLLLVLDL